MEDKILDILKETFELETADKSCSQSTCEKWDSLHHLALAMNLEETFDIELEPEEIAAMKSYDDIVRILQAKQGSR